MYCGILLHSPSSKQSSEKTLELTLKKYLDIMIRQKFQDEKKSIREHYRKTTQGFVGVGLGNSGDADSHGEDCVRIYVTKLDKSHVDGKHGFADGSKADLKFVDVGKIRLTGFLGRNRPTQPGAILGAVGCPLDGTFGAIVTDNTDGKKVILSCNHVLANWSTLPAGTAILQPGPNHAGVSPADQIGTLKRAVPANLGMGGINYVDAAIATPTNSTIYKTTPFCASVKPTLQGAVGMIWAASPYITIVCPANNISSLMNVTFPKSKVATVGMSIHACTAKSGYIATTVSDVLVDLLLTTDDGNDVWFMDQTITVGGIADGDGGDSGGVFYTTFNV